MASPIGKTEFLRRCREDLKRIGHQGENYLTGQNTRLFQSFRIVSELLEDMPGKRITSIGAGSGYLEARLAEECGAQISVVDFPEAIEMNKAHFEKYGMRTLGGNITDPASFGALPAADMVLSLEVIEHVPIPPREFVGNFAAALKPGGLYIVTTPSLSRLSNIYKLVKNQGILPHPDVWLSDSRFETEHIHRREYNEREIIDALAANGIVHEKSLFGYYGPSTTTFRAIVKSLFYPVELAFPYFRPCMTIIGRKS